MSKSLSCNVKGLRLELAILEQKLQCEGRLKEYDAPWLENAKTVVRDSSGRFASKVNNIEESLSNTTKQARKSIGEVWDLGTDSFVAGYGLTKAIIQNPERTIMPTLKKMESSAIRIFAELDLLEKNNPKFAKKLKKVAKGIENEIFSDYGIDDNFCVQAIRMAKEKGGAFQNTDRSLKEMVTDGILFAEAAKHVIKNPEKRENKKLLGKALSVGTTTMCVVGFAVFPEFLFAMAMATELNLGAAVLEGGIAFVMDKFMEKGAENLKKKHNRQKRNFEDDAINKLIDAGRFFSSFLTVPYASFLVGANVLARIERKAISTATKKNTNQFMENSHLFKNTKPEHIVQEELKSPKYVEGFKKLKEAIDLDLSHSVRESLIKHNIDPSKLAERYSRMIDSHIDSLQNKIDDVAKDLDLPRIDLSKFDKSWVLDHRGNREEDEIIAKFFETAKQKFTDKYKVLEVEAIKGRKPGEHSRLLKERSFLSYDANALKTSNKESLKPWFLDADGHSSETNQAMRFASLRKMRSRIIDVGYGDQITKETAIGMLKMEEKYGDKINAFISATKANSDKAVDEFYSAFTKEQSAQIRYKNDVKSPTLKPKVEERMERFSKFVSGDIKGTIWIKQTKEGSAGRPSAIDSSDTGMLAPALVLPLPQAHKRIAEINTAIKDAGASVGVVAIPEFNIDDLSAEIAHLGVDDIMYHELAHIIEKRKHIVPYSRKFMGKSLSTNNLPRPFAGRNYAGRVESDFGTEVLSVGIENLMNPNLLKDFAARDREHLLFTMLAMES